MRPTTTPSGTPIARPTVTVASDCHATVARNIRLLKPRALRIASSRRRSCTKDAEMSVRPTARRCRPRPRGARRGAGSRRSRSRAVDRAGVRHRHGPVGVPSQFLERNRRDERPHDRCPGRRRTPVSTADSVGGRSTSRCTRRGRGRQGGEAAAGDIGRTDDLHATATAELDEVARDAHLVADGPTEIGGGRDAEHHLVDAGRHTSRDDRQLRRRRAAEADRRRDRPPAEADRHVEGVEAVLRHLGSPIRRLSHNGDVSRSRTPLPR